MKSRFSIGLCGLLVALALSAQSSAAIIVNGDFEQPVVAPFGALVVPTGVPAIPGWDVTAGSVCLYNAASGIPVIEGVQSLLLWLPGSTVEQYIPTVPGITYSVSFDASAANQSPFAIQYEAFGIGGTLAGGVYVGGAAAPASLPYFYTFTADSTLTDIKFSSPIGQPSNWPILDNVRVVDINVPEPHAAFAAALGLVGFAFWRRRVS